MAIQRIMELKERLEEFEEAESNESHPNAIANGIPAKIVARHGD